MDGHSVGFSHQSVHPAEELCRSGWNARGRLRQERNDTVTAVAVLGTVANQAGPTCIWPSVIHRVAIGPRNPPRILRSLALDSLLRRFSDLNRRGQRDRGLQ